MKALENLLKFGFNKRSKSTYENKTAIVDVKIINKDYVSIRFFNNKGDVICFEVNVSEIEFIEWDVKI